MMYLIGINNQEVTFDKRIRMAVNIVSFLSLEHINKFEKIVLVRMIIVNCFTHGGEMYTAITKITVMVYMVAVHVYSSVQIVLICS